MARFYPLRVTEITPTTREAIAVTLVPRDADAEAFAFTQGQYLTFRHEVGGVELRRSYSICADPAEGVLRVGIKRVAGGVFSNWANDSLKVGDEIEAMPPDGRFFTPLDGDNAGTYLAFAGGSGITPILSIIRATLRQEPQSRFTLVYANRASNTIMFREELEDIKNLYMDRFSIVHVLEENAQDIEIFTGRVDRAKCDALFARWIDIGAVDQVFICGPEPMMRDIEQALLAHDVPQERIKYELFASTPVPASLRPVAAADGQAGQGAEVTILLDGTRRTIKVPRAGETVLESALAADIDAPYSCKAGVCSTCKARVESGEVEMAANHALEDYEVEQGYVLTCQCHPVSDKVVLNYNG